MWLKQTEETQFWLTVMNALQPRRLRDILMRQLAGSRVFPMPSARCFRALGPGPHCSI